MSLETSPNATELTATSTADTGIRARAESILREIQHAFEATWTFLRFVLFILYMVVGVIAFWLWLFAVVFSLFRFGLRCLMKVLLRLSGGAAPWPGPPPPTITASMQRELDELWAGRLVAYEAVMFPLGRRYVHTAHSLRTFWHWHLSRKVVTLLFIGFFIGVPLMYFVPRSNYVQVTDDNAIQSDEGGRVTYLVHALDLFEPGRHREYENEDMWWLGKINSQGVKSQLVIGRYYRLQVVGIRWYWKPRLFPNIVSATEVDEQGTPLDQASSRVASPSGPAPRTPTAR